jgi:hypothetical protein
MSVENQHSREKVEKNRKRIFHLLDGIFLALLVAYVFLGMTRVPFFGDESTFVRLSMDFAYIFQDHDIQKVVYRSLSESESTEPYTNEYLEQYNRLLTGAINPLTIGLAWNAAGMNRGDLNGFWQWWSPMGSNQWSFNVLNGNMPSPYLLSIARIPSTLFTAISIVVIFVVALGLSRSRPAAWIAAFLYATTPSILDNGRMAMQEGALLLFTSLVVLCALSILRLIREGKPRWRRIFLGYGLLGLASGLALTGKENSALIIVPAYLAVFIVLWSAGRELEPREKKAARFRLFFGLLGSGLLGLSVFYILMPVWWLYPFNGLILLCLSAICFRVGLTKPRWWIWIVQTISVTMLLLITVFVPGGWSGIYQPIQIMVQARADLIRAAERPGVTLTTFESRIGEMADQLLFAKTEYWAAFPESLAQIRIYKDYHLDGRRGGTVWGIVILVLVAGGLWVTLAARRGWETLFLMLWLAVPAVILLITNSLPWQRYYIMLIAPWSVLAGFAAVPITSSDFLGSVRKFLVRRSSVVKSA